MKKIISIVNIFKKRENYSKNWEIATSLENFSQLFYVVFAFFIKNITV